MESEKPNLEWQSKKRRMQGAQILKNAAYDPVRRNDEGCRATPQAVFLRSHLF